LYVSVSSSLSLVFTLRFLADSVRSTVTDGVTIGRPCCAVHDCKEPLPTVKHRFCQTHNQLIHLCAVENCQASVEPGFRTCKIKAHRNLEDWHNDQSKAMFQLKRRLERLHVAQTHDSLAIDPESAKKGRDGNDGEVFEGLGADEDEDVSVDQAGICDGKPGTGNRSLRARFGRRRTHNEQLCVGSCGVILGRATFFGSEAPNGVRVSHILLC